MLTYADMAGVMLTYADMAGVMQAQHRKAAQQAITSVAAIALAIGADFQPYYQEFMPRLTQVYADGC
jgi:hypothetical protein